MKKLLLVLAILMLVSSTAYGNDKATLLLPDTVTTPPDHTVIPHPDKLLSNVIKRTVMLTLEGAPFCSGILATDPTGRTYVYTAAHCCAVYESRPIMQAAITTQVNTTFTIKAPTDASYAADTLDACRLETTTPLRSPIKIAPLTDRNLFVVSAFPNYSPYERITRLFVVGRLIEEGGLLVTSGNVFPGMSGSPVIDRAGNVVGIAVAHYLNTPYPNCIITPLNDTGFLSKE